METTSNTYTLDAVTGNVWKGVTQTSKGVKPDLDIVILKFVHNISEVDGLSEMAIYYTNVQEIIFPEKLITLSDVSLKAFTKLTRISLPICLSSFDAKNVQSVLDSLKNAVPGWDSYCFSIEIVHNPNNNDDFTLGNTDNSSDSLSGSLSGYRITVHIDKQNVDKSKITPMYYDIQQTEGAAILPVDFSVTDLPIILGGFLNEANVVNMLTTLRLKLTSLQTTPPIEVQPHTEKQPNISMLTAIIILIILILIYWYFFM